MIRHGIPALVLAPMEGYIDAPMRALLTEQGSGVFDFCVSEFQRVSQEILKPQSFFRGVPELKSLAQTPSQVPVQVQILGGDPERMAHSAFQAYVAGARSIDINFGCPAPTVNRNDGGATLLKFPERIFAIVKAVRDILPDSIPVSAKLRLGWDSNSDIYENASQAEKAGASWITIHGRTKVQGYNPPAYWGPISEVRKQLKIPVVANGDIWNVQDFLNCRKQTGCEHFMLGRGVLADPNLPLKIARILKPETGFVQSCDNLASVSWLTLLNRFNFHCARLTDHPTYSSKRMKQWLKLVHGRTPLLFFDQVKKCVNTSEILSIVTEYR